MNEYGLRFSGLQWANKTKELNVLIIGAGGIGSWTALLLSRIGFDSITVVDFDTVEATNIGGQFYSTDDIGYPKVIALKNAIQTYSNYDIKNLEMMIDEEDTSILYKLIVSSDIIIGAVDNMVARRLLLETTLKCCSNNNDHDKLFIDGRLLAEFYHVISFTMDNTVAIEKYKSEYLFSDEEILEVACTSKATSYYGAGIAFEIHKKITSHIMNRFFDGVDDLPFEIKNYRSLC